MNENIFDKLDFGPFRSLLDNDDITDISYDNNGQIWVRSLTQGSMRVEIEGATPEFVEKLAFQCSNVMGTTFNNAKPFLDAESAELRMNFVHQSIATNGIALVIRKTPAKIRLEKEKLIKEDYFTPAIHDLLIKCVEGHCNIMVSGETGSGKTEFVKYLASHTIQNEKIITIEDTLELHLDKIYPQRDIVAMKTNNVASYSDVLVTCMRQNPKWILLSEVRSAEAVSAVRNSISSGHNILSTIHADKASAIPYRLYSLMETDLDVHQFLTTIYRYIQIGVHIKAFYSKEYGQFHREVDEVCEFYVDENNEPQTRIIYQKQMGKIMMCKPSAHLIEYIENQNINIQDIIKDLPDELPIVDASSSSTNTSVVNNSTNTSVVNNSTNTSVTNSSTNTQQEPVKNEPVILPMNNTNSGVGDGAVPIEDSNIQLVVTDPSVPGAKVDDVSSVNPGAEVGIAESVPIIAANGDVQLSNPVVSSEVIPMINDTTTTPIVDPNAAQSIPGMMQQQQMPVPGNSSNLPFPQVGVGMANAQPSIPQVALPSQAVPAFVANQPPVIAPDGDAQITSFQNVPPVLTAAGNTNGNSTIVVPNQSVVSPPVGAPSMPNVVPNLVKLDV